MQFPLFEQLNSNSCTEKSIKLHYPDFHKYLINNYPGELIWGERLYWFYNNLKDYPKCYCGNKTGFINFKKGYKIFCCVKCSNNDPNKKEKTKQTCIEKYGGIAPASSKEILKKMQNTTIDKYGVYNIQKLNITKKKTRQTCLKKYSGQGNESNILKEKQKQTCLEKYGIDHPSKTIEVKTKIKESRRKFEMINHEYILGYTNDGQWVCKCPHPNCNKCKNKQFIISPLRYEGRIKERTEICTNLKPIGSDSTKGSYPEQLIRNMLDKHNISYITNIRNIINPKELDIYIFHH